MRRIRCGVSGHLKSNRFGLREKWWLSLKDNTYKYEKPTYLLRLLKYSLHSKIIFE